MAQETRLTVTGLPEEVRLSDRPFPLRAAAEAKARHPTAKELAAAAGSVRAVTTNQQEAKDRLERSSVQQVSAALVVPGHRAADRAAEHRPGNRPSGNHLAVAAAVVARTTAARTARQEWSSSNISRVEVRHEADFFNFFLGISSSGR